MKTSRCLALLFLAGIVAGCYPVPVSNNASKSYSDSDYYYYPDQEVYYYPATSKYIYFDGGGWTYATALPSRYSINPYMSNRVVLNYSGKDPYRYHDRYREEYPRGYRGQKLTSPSRQSNYNPSDQRGNNAQRQTIPAKQVRGRRSQVDGPGKPKPIKPERGVKSEK